MANENNNINELVAADDDPTVELELLDAQSDMLESDAITYRADEHKNDSRSAPASTVAELTSELRARRETIDQLQYDLQHLQAKWQGLETEVNAREEQSSALSVELATAKDNALRKERLLKKRDRKIKTLKAEIRQRDGEQRTLSNRCDELQASLDSVTRADAAVDSPASDSSEGLAKTYPGSELRARLERSDEYADSMRRQLQDLMEAHAAAKREIDHYSRAAEKSTHKILQLSDTRANLSSEIDELTEQLDKIQSRHNDDIRALRFELTDAQSTMTESKNLNTQLASELVDVQGFKIELENMLSVSEKQSAVRIESLQKEKDEVEQSNKTLEQKLTSKNEAITALLAELAKKSEQIEAIGELGDEIESIGERSPNRGARDIAPGDGRVSRVLVGSVDDQVLRFPLFKDRLTIGRTKDNDVQLDAAYISRRHAVIQIDETDVRIIDWGSKNGVHVNSERIDEHFLQHGDVIMIGNARFRYEEHKKKET